MKMIQFTALGSSESIVDLTSHQLRSPTVNGRKGLITPSLMTSDVSRDMGFFFVVRGHTFRVSADTLVPFERGGCVSRRGLLGSGHRPWRHGGLRLAAVQGHHVCAVEVPRAG
jgi:hypothetical protein